ncbi:hypothetical protein KOI35_12045 [Actinoplanes bogorensis]|uniref:DUF4034 domain-containing protein n=1 Tax=Paractinoplanes bogorensis TaxID=1610840 RepID=A0ABS5YL77_9ACTN|nr:hypothetical protein [Actinoplanes bogorensis]MBU2664224.1 hypothetical protein [Actinoplanes bogorensis]
MEAGERDLARMRASGTAWPELAYEQATGDDGYDFDRNAVARAQVLWALQYDRRPGDHALVRWLAEQEAVCRREAPFQGLTEETELAGLLLAEYRRPADVWLQWQLKRANFDTWCGYDIEHVVAAGADQTLSLVRASEHDHRTDILERLLDAEGRPALSDEDVAEWFEQQRLRFPPDPAAEDPLTWIARAQLIGDRALARDLIDRWAADRPRDQATVTQLRYELAAIGAFAEAAAAQRERLTFAEGAWDTASGWCELAELERRAGHHVAAWEALRTARRALDDVSGWTEVGLGRGYMAEMFQLAVAAPSEPAHEIFTAADAEAGSFPGLPLNTLRFAVEAAVNVGDEPRAEHYRQLAAAEQQRISRPG